MVMVGVAGATVVVLQSTFVFPIAGVLYFRQVEGEDVQMWGKVYWVNNAGDSIDHNWHIHQRAVSIVAGELTMLLAMSIGS